MTTEEIIEALAPLAEYADLYGYGEGNVQLEFRKQDLRKAQEVLDQLVAEVEEDEFGL